MFCVVSLHSLSCVEHPEPIFLGCHPSRGLGSQVELLSSCRSGSVSLSGKLTESKWPRSTLVMITWFLVVCPTPQLLLRGHNHSFGDWYHPVRANSKTDMSKLLEDVCTYGPCRSRVLVQLAAGSQCRAEKGKDWVRGSLWALPFSSIWCSRYTH